MRELIQLEFPCLVALSGGADSRVLLELAVRAALERRGDGEPVAADSPPVVAAHLHHGIRGKEADRDEAFCREVCNRLGVPLVVGHADIPALAAASGQSEETAAREARYAFLVRVMKEWSIPRLLTAHNADDQLETVLSHLLRGSGTRGMGGIPPSRPLGDTLPDGTPLTVHRPLLELTRREILGLVQALALDYVTDSTNLADICTRNRLRHHVTPLLEELTGPDAPQRAVARLARNAREDEEALAALSRARYEAVRSESGLPADSVAQQMPAVAKRMIRLAYEEFLHSDNGFSDVPEDGIPSDRTLSAAHLEAILALCRDGCEGQVSDLLPADVRGELRGGALIFTVSRPTTPAPSPLPRPIGAGLCDWCTGIRIRLDTADTPLQPLTDAEDGVVFASAVFPAEALPLPLCARSREPGDAILSHGMTKKLKKLICDKHIPQDLRDRLPLFCTQAGEPLWFPCVAFRDGFAAPTVGPSIRLTVLIGDFPASH